MNDFTFDPIKHRYYYDGRHVPNVTSLEEEYGLINFDGVPRDRLEYKTVLGSAVHYAIMLHNQDNLNEESLDPRIKGFFLAYRKFTEVFKYEPRRTELRLYSKKWRFAGTLDSQGLFYWKQKEIEAIIDWKCTWALYPANAVQTAAYQILLEENYPDIKIKGRFSLQLKDTGCYELLEHTDKTDRNTFLAALTLHYWRVKYGLIKQTEE